MKLNLLISCIFCALTLAGCYRQTEEPFQQVDSAIVEAPEPTSPSAALEGGGEAVGAVVVTREAYITPETVPGQVEQAAAGAPRATQVLLAQLTVPPLDITRLAPATPTLTFEEQLDPADACVYSVLQGDTLFRLSLSWGTTVDDILQQNQLESDALSISQLLLIPGCQTEAPEPETPADAPADAPEPEAPASAEESAPPVIPTASPVSEEAAPADSPTPGPRIHVVSAGDTLESISLQYRADVNALIALNNLINPDRLTVGQELEIPE